MVLNMQLNSSNRLYINIVISFIMILVAPVIIVGFNKMFGPITAAAQNIDLSIKSLPGYALRTTMRFILAMILSVVFALIYAVLAAKNKRIGAFLIPLLDIFQSVPVLGYLSFTVTAFLAIAPGNIFGIEMAIIFALFTAQVWNIIFSVYQSLTTIPKELYDVSDVYKLNKWQIFWQVELPFAIPGIIWNMALSISSSWFFIVASEAISVGTQTYTLPGLGVYISIALQNTNIEAVIYAMLTILAVIFIFNQLLFAPLISWSHKFRYEFNTGVTNTSSWLFDYLSRSTLFDSSANFFGRLSDGFLQIRLPHSITKHAKMISYIFEIIWWALIACSLGLIFKQVYVLFENHMSYGEVIHVIKLGAITSFRVLAMLLVSSIFWVPIGIFISLRPALVERIQPLLQFLTAIPANVYFPIFVITILHFNLNPEIWLSLMMIIGAQWYIVYNVIAGGQAIPTELLEASKNLKLSGLNRWIKLILPAILPFYITGMITASGAAWNASIVAEIITWGKDTITATGLGSYITINTSAGDFAKIAIGVIIMSCYVVIVNNILWQPLYDYASKKFRLE